MDFYKELMNWWWSQRQIHKEGEESGHTGPRSVLPQFLISYVKQKNVMVLYSDIITKKTA